MEGIDIERVIKERDFSTVDHHIHHVLDCQLESEFDVRILDAGFVKLFRLSQLAVEYLLQGRRQLDAAIPGLENQLHNMAEEIEQLRRQLRNKEDEVRKLRNRTRKQSKAISNVQNQDFTSMLKQMAWNGANMGVPNITTEHFAGAAFHKCPNCDKNFLNQFYLQSHLVRRHPGYPLNVRPDNDQMYSPENHSSPEHGVYRVETDKLNLEIKELKQRLNATEKRLQSHSETDKNGVKLVEVPNEGIVEKKNGDKDESKDNNGTKYGDKVKMDYMEKETLTVNQFEEWKKEEQIKFSNELEKLKKNLLESLKSAKDESKDGVESVEAKRQQEKIADVVKKQEEELKILKEQLKEKVSTQNLEVTSRLEAQERFWRAKLQSTEFDHKKTIEELQATMLNHLSESQKAQEQFKTRISQLEDRAKDQDKFLEEKMREQKVLEEEARKWSAIAESKTKENEILLASGAATSNGASTNRSLGSQRRLFVGVSQETLPPYEEDIVKRDSEHKNIQLQVLHRERHNKNFDKKKSNINALYKNSTESSDSESGGDRRMKNGRTKKISRGNTSISSDSSYRKNKQRGGRRKQMKSVNKEMRNGEGSMRKRAQSESRVSQKEKAPVVMKRVLSAEDVRLKKAGKKTETSDEATTHDEDATDNKLSDEESPEETGILARQPSVMKAVRKDLKVIVENRVQQLGFKPKTKGISNVGLKKGLELVQHRRHLVAKQHDGYNKIRKAIVSKVDEKSKQMERDGKKSKESVNSQSSRSNISLKVGSLFSNVKNKALAMMRPKDNGRNVKADINEEEIVREIMKDKKAGVKEDGEYYKKMKEMAKKSQKQVKDNATSEKMSVLSILNSMNDLRKANNAKLASVDDSKANEKTDESLSETDASSDEESSFEEEDKHTKTVTAANVSNASSSKSIENLLNSPVRKPGQNSKDSSIASSTPTRRIESVANSFGDMSHVATSSKIYNVQSNQSKNTRISKSEENITSMYAGASSSSSESISEGKPKESDGVRKSVSEENVSGTNLIVSPKGVLKSVLSTGSLSKKKVIFDLDANEMKSMSASPSGSGKMDVKANWEKRADANTDSDSDWNLSNVEEEPPNHKATIHSQSNASISLSTRQSPNIAELSKSIGAQLNARSEKPPTGGINTMFQAKTTSANYLTSSTTSVASSIIDGNTLNMASTSGYNQPVPRPRTAMQKKNKLDSDLEMSDWSIEELLNAK